MWCRYVVKRNMFNYDCDLSMIMECYNFCFHNENKKQIGYEDM